MATAVLLTGRPGVGKTTVLQQVVARLPGTAGGFYTQEVREGGERAGFELVTLDGEGAVLASTRRSGPPRVGKYGVDLAVMERLAVPALRRAAREADYVVVDEIGRMELLSDAFAATIRELLSGPYRVLGTIMARPHPIADELKRLAGVRLLEVTRANRERLDDEVLSLLTR